MIPSKEEHLTIFRKKIGILEKIVPYRSQDKISICSILWFNQTIQVKQLLNWLWSVTAYMSCNDAIDKGIDEIIELCNEIRSIKK